MASELTLLLYFDQGYVPSKSEIEEAFDCDVVEYDEQEV